MHIGLYKLAVGGLLAILFVWAPEARASGYTTALICSCTGNASCECPIQVNAAAGENNPSEYRLMCNGAGMNAVPTAVNGIPPLRSQPDAGSPLVTRYWGCWPPIYRAMEGFMFLTCQADEDVLDRDLSMNLTMACAAAQ